MWSTADLFINFFTIAFALRQMNFKILQISVEVDELEQKKRELFSIYWTNTVALYIINNYTVSRIWAHWLWVIGSLAMSSYTTNGIIDLLYRQTRYFWCCVVKQLPDFLLIHFSKTFSHFVFFTTNRIWSDSLLVEEPIKLHNSSYTVFVYIYNKSKYLKGWCTTVLSIYGKRALTFWAEALLFYYFLRRRAVARNFRVRILYIGSTPILYI